MSFCLSTAISSALLKSVAPLACDQLGTIRECGIQGSSGTVADSRHNVIRFIEFTNDLERFKVFYEVEHCYDR